VEILIFVAVIVVLIVVHEVGHFIVAKLSGMRVDEFGLGYPPRALTITKIGETTYTLNWLPFGGFVKIHGENGGEDDERSFSKRPRILQVAVLIAGVSMNIIFAYVLITGALVAGTPRALNSSEIAIAQNVQLAVANVLPSSPASRAGLVPGDSILKGEDALGSWDSPDPKSFSAFVSSSGGNDVTLLIKHNGNNKKIIAKPTAGIIKSDPTRYAIGVEVGTIGVVPISFGKAIKEGAILTWGATILTAQGLWNFFYSISTFSANLSQVAGPIGIAGVVGSAYSQGFGDLLSIMAIISINLAIINLIPIPALDGGRILFVIIESIIRRPIKKSITNIMNTVSFALLILLMVVVTAHDIFKIFS